MATANNKAPSTHQGLAIASLILGIVSIVTAIVWVLAFISGILAIVFGAVSLKTIGRKKALAGIITGGVGIVLSILLIALVFAALPVVQGAQRDTQRKSDVASLMADVTEYQSNHKGALPTASELSTDGLSIIATVGSINTFEKNNAFYTPGVNCDGEEVSARNYSITTLLENGSNYCLDS